MKFLGIYVRKFPIFSVFEIKWLNFNKQKLFIQLFHSVIFWKFKIFIKNFKKKISTRIQDERISFILYPWKAQKSHLVLLKLKLELYPEKIGFIKFLI
jgi:hypothetical protein